MIKAIPKNSNIQLSQNIHSNEVDCRCSEQELCTWTLYSPQLLELFEQLRARLGDNAIKINSFFRCQYWNLEIGGKRKSSHVVGKAFDLACPDWIRFRDFVKITEKAGFDKVIPYKTKRFIHCHLKE